MNFEEGEGVEADIAKSYMEDCKKKSSESSWLEQGGLGAPLKLLTFPKRGDKIQHTS